MFALFLRINLLKLIFIILYLMWLVAFKIFSLSVVLSNLTVTCFYAIFFVFHVLVVHWSWIYEFIVSIKFKHYLANISSNILVPPPLLWRLQSSTLCMYIRLLIYVHIYKYIHKVLHSWLMLFKCFLFIFICVSFCIVSSLSSYSLAISFAMSNLPAVTFSVFCISTTVISSL